MTGRWEGPDVNTPLMEAWRKFDPRGLTDPAEFHNAMWQTGLLLRKAYYVPDADELLGMMTTLQYHLVRGAVGCRWVMCRETVDALARKWSRKVVPAPIQFDAEFWRNDGSELPTAALEMEVLTIIEHNRYWDDHARLFGVAIRMDPAARSPLFEIDTPATDTRPPGTVDGG